jgi:hypothetical protein
MKRGRSTGKPTQAEAARIVACKEGPCIACLIRSEQPDAPWNFRPWIGGDYHHLLSGGRRIGHMAGVCLCPWHHRQVPDWGCSPQEMSEHYGPSLMDGSKTFHAAFGSDAELLAKQNELLGEQEAA